MKETFEEYKRYNRPNVYTKDIGAVDMEDVMPLKDLISELQKIQEESVKVGNPDYRYMGTYVYFDDMYSTLEVFHKYAELDAAYAKRIYEEWEQEQQRLELLEKARKEKMNNDYERIKETELQMLYKLAHKYKKELK